MKKIQFAPKKDFLERLSNAGSIKALSELIWNGLDAGSDTIEVSLESNDMEGLECIRVADQGTGIYYPHLDSLFGDLGASWKQHKIRENGRAIHGKKGQGRLKAFALGNEVKWKTVFKDEDSNIKSYTIHGRGSELESMSCSDPMQVDANTQSGTEVIVSSIEKSHGALLAESAHTELAKIFAPYLSQYPNVSIVYNGATIDPAAHQNRTKEIHLDPIQLEGGKTADVTISIVEWNMDTKREIHLCDANGVSLHETKALGRFRAPNIHFTAYIKTDHFVDLAQAGKLEILEDSLPDVSLILEKSRKAISKYFRRRQAELQSGAVERWKAEEIYPFEDKEQIDPVEEAERQVFDILAVNVESYLPTFEDSDKQTKQFTFRLIAQALKHNPKSLQEVISGVLKLNKDDQEDLADLMRQTSLTSIISTAKTVANRLDFLNGLEQLLFDAESKEKLLERDQLHKILDNEAWLFDEGFGLAGTEQRLEEVLEKHIGELREKEYGEVSVEVGDGKTGRIDLLLSKANEPKTGTYDYLVVELKRPKQKINGKTVRQVKNYAKAVAGDERFKGIPAEWKFLAVSNELNSEAEDDANQQGQPSGRVWINKEGNISVWVITWAELINNARAKLAFINKDLDYQSTRDSAKAYLKKAHAKFIPETAGYEDPQEEE